MEVIWSYLVETVLDPAVVTGAVAASLVLLSGLPARALELGLHRRPGRRHADG